MDSRLIFQLTASAIASVCSGASLALWILSTEALSQPGLTKRRLILSQAVVSGVIILGSVVSVFLTIRQVNSQNNSFWLILNIEIGCVLILHVLNEYLSVSTLQHRSTHIVAGFFSISAIIVLSLSIYLSEHRIILLLLFMVINLISLGFVYVQFIKYWVICMKPRQIQMNVFKLFWWRPSHAAPKHRQALWGALMASIGLFLLLLGFTILACTKPCLWTQIATVGTFTIFAPRVTHTVL
ncbi:hypothetical protein BDW59DRAFT_177057 [Aspergillus cavernicola]|uniref:Uncharacterized protein n=1 Tax=Aspergillus cavernicola TaxID=176166 RepID=A0ABR4H8P0_9EURO